MKKHALQKHAVLSTGYGELQLQYRCQVELPSAHLMPTERMSPKDKRRRLSARRTSGTKDAAIASAASSSSALSPGDSGREAQVKLTAQRLDLRPGLGSRGVPSIPQHWSLPLPSLTCMLEWWSPQQSSDPLSIGRSISSRNVTTAMDFLRNFNDTSKLVGKARATATETLVAAMRKVSEIGAGTALSLSNMLQHGTALSDAEHPESTLNELSFLPPEV